MVDVFVLWDNCVSDSKKIELAKRLKDSVVGRSYFEAYGVDPEVSIDKFSSYLQYGRRSLVALGCLDDEQLNMCLRFGADTVDDLLKSCFRDMCMSRYDIKVYLNLLNSLGLKPLAYNKYTDRRLDCMKIDELTDTWLMGSDNTDKALLLLENYGILKLINILSDNLYSTLNEILFENRVVTNEDVDNLYMGVLSHVIKELNIYENEVGLTVKECKSYAINHKYTVCSVLGSCNDNTSAYKLCEKAYGLGKRIGYICPLSDDILDVIHSIRWSDSSIVDQLRSILLLLSDDEIKEMLSFVKSMHKDCDFTGFELFIKGDSIEQVAEKLGVVRNIAYDSVSKVIKFIDDWISCDGANLISFGLDLRLVGCLNRFGIETRQDFINKYKSCNGHMKIRGMTDDSFKELCELFGCEYI